ncbi:MAG: imidazoleglycerol-phosphate dehydratase [Archaeoglobaceae archaeon]|nr:imidazoleglycerol-phosphate dehydratase [Archaeoglobaceae archaeon]MDW7989298.1 imidazoleglycerol-phosphate dehydratase [Archaeoglobaceae archaeon]
MKKVNRKTYETEVLVIFNSEKTEINTGIDFFDHMLGTLSKISGFKMEILAKGKDVHHIIEDVAICLGKSISEVEKRGIERFGYAIVPMDESVAICAIDFSGRGFFVFEGDLKDGLIRVEDFLHFFDTLCRNSGLNLYLAVKGRNSHHMMESCFKAFALSLKQALRKTGEDYRSTKGVLD